ncbi:MAG TPA: ChbG/HpnK family deacetylase [Gemmataceae bacterium]|nr:ChbG/HpnK family deacetylase [Gemmataceae bacterium]
MAGRRLIVNADDFGLSPGVNRGVVAAHENGIVTSACLMVRWPAAGEAATYARAHPALSVGLHFDFGEWAFQGGAWAALYEVVPLGNAAAVQAEAVRQLAEFRRMVRREPTHLDSHQHVHRRAPTRTVVEDLGRDLGVPVRDLTPGIRYCGDFYGQDGEGNPHPELVTAEALIALLRRLPDGVTELGCHPGDGGGLETMYVRERAAEVAALCDPRVRAAVTELGIELVSFGCLHKVGLHAETGP